MTADEAGGPIGSRAICLRSSFTHRGPQPFGTRRFKHNTLKALGVGERRADAGDRAVSVPVSFANPLSCDGMRDAAKLALG